MEQDVFEGFLEDAKDKLGNIKDTEGDQEKTIKIDSSLKASEFYIDFDDILKMNEEEVHGSVKGNGNYYLIEIDNNGNYVADIRDNPEHLVYYIPRLAFEYGLTYEDSNSCYSLADTVDKRTEITDEYNKMDVALTVIIIYLLMESKIDEDFEEFKILGNTIEKRRFDEISEKISLEFNQVTI